MIKDYLKFAVNSLLHRKIRSWLTMLGIFIGVAAFVAVFSLGDGLKLVVASQFGVSSTEVITVQAGGLTAAGPPGTGVTNPLTNDDVDAIERLSSVELAIPRIILQGKMEFNDIIGVGYATNIPDGEDRKFIYEQLELEAESGRLLKDGDNKKVLLGYNFGTDRNGMGKAVRPGNTVLVNDVKFEVVGINKKKGSFILDNMVIMNDASLLGLMDDPDRVDIIAVKVKESNLMDKAKADIEELLRKRRDVRKGEEDFSVQTPDAALSSVNSVLTGVQVFISLIAIVAVVIGAIGIVNTMTTSVLERRRQIGIMKAIGARNKDIFWQFFIESGLMGLVGGFVGAVIGKLIGYAGTVGINAFAGASVSPGLSLGLISFTLLGSFIIGALAGIVPALQAANEEPVDALRG